MSRNPPSAAPSGSFRAASVRPAARRSDSIPVAGHATVADGLALMLSDLGVQQAFGLVGGSIAAICEALERTPIQVVHCRHETGAALAATEAYFAGDRPTMLFATTGPGLANSVNGLLAARWEGAKVVLVSATTPAAQRGKWAFQETTRQTLPESLFQAGPIFHYAHELEDGSQLREVERQLRSGFHRPGGFVAHILVPSSAQTQRWSVSRLHGLGEPHHPIAEPTIIRKCAEVLASEPFVIWVGFGARHAAAELRELVDRTGAQVICSPRAKGIFPEDDPRFLGVTGFAGDPDVEMLLRQQRPSRVLVLGSRLGEFTSFWNTGLIPEKGLIHIDVDPEVPGAAFPEVPTQGVHAEIGGFLRALLEQLPDTHHQSVELSMARSLWPERPEGTVRPQVLMNAIQRIVVDGSDVPILVDVGNCFAWATHHLRFNTPGRFRVSMGWGSMGQAAAGAVGSALARRGKVVAIVGDGAMLMQNEINTAVAYAADVVFIVLNDSQYGMIEQGMRGLKMKPVQTQMPLVDFVGFARSLGADGVTVEHETDVKAALEAAMQAKGAFVVDVRIDRREQAPMGRRIANLIEQGVEGSGDAGR